MFIPLHDRNALQHIRLQYVTITLIAANLVGYLATAALPERVVAGVVYALGFIPAVALGSARLDPDLALVAPAATFVTYAFLHGDIWHLAGNMLFLWVFGDNIEDAFGHLKFLLFYLLCAAAGAAVHGMVAPGSEAPLIGASGAVSGIVAAYLLLHPKVRIWVLVLMRIPLPLPAFVPLIAWVAQQFAMLAFGAEAGVSFGAHVGGILAGGLLTLILRRPGVPLLDSTLVTPRAVRHAGNTEEAASPAPERQPRWGR